MGRRVVWPRMGVKLRRPTFVPEGRNEGSQAAFGWVLYRILSLSAEALSFGRST
jgi:hypothetical protein